MYRIAVKNFIHDLNIYDPSRELFYVGYSMEQER